MSSFASAYMWNEPGKEAGEGKEDGMLDRFRSASTVASLSELLPGSPRQGFARQGLQLVLGAVDPVQLLGFCAPRALLRLQATSAAFGGQEGLLDPSVLRRLATAYLHSPASKGARSLQDAAELGDLDAMWAHLFLGVQPNDYDEHGCLALHHAADKNNVAAYKMLVQVGADIHAPHCGLNIRVGWTPLHFAAYGGSRDVLLLLLLQGAPVNEMDRCRRTALYYSRSRGREACGRLLEKFGGVEDLHLVEPRHLQEAQRLDDGANFARRDQDVHHWDASADAADMYAEGAVVARQYSDGDGVGRRPEAEAAPVPRYIGPAGDSGPSLTQAAMSMPEFEW